MPRDDWRLRRNERRLAADERQRCLAVAITGALILADVAFRLLLRTLS